MPLFRLFFVFESNFQRRLISAFLIIRGKSLVINAQRGVCDRLQ